MSQHINSRLGAYFLYDTLHDIQKNDCIVLLCYLLCGLGRLMDSVCIVSPEIDGSWLV